MTATPLPPIAKSVEKIALELLFAEPGKDGGLLPVNSLLGTIEDALASSPAPEPIAATLRLARADIDAALDAGSFSDQSLKRLTAWTTWMQQALPATARNHPPPDLPGILQQEPASNLPSPGPASHDLESTCVEVLELDLSRDAEMLREFLNESDEHLHNIEQSVLALEQNPGDPETLNSIFRSFHTFKGGSGFLNLVPIHSLAHELESLLDRARQGRLQIDAGVIDLILAGSDALRRFVTEIEAQLAGARPAEPILVPIHGLIERIQDTLRGHSQPATAAQTSSSADSQTQPLQPTPTPVPNSRAASTARAATGFVKVSTQKLDALVDLAGELVISQSLVAQDSDVRALQSPQLVRHLAQLSRITAEVQKTATALRMVPIKGTFEKMNRLVRDLSLKAGKQVDLRFQGEETELDRSLIDELDDPLVHMIRNAADHGIEAPDVRVAHGKPPRGLIRLAASHQAGNIVIEIHDDGAGLDRDRILAKARQQGLVGPDENPSDSDIFRLIFAPGFSTAERVTELSGRGVGMDVVRRNIANLRGKITVDSVRGQGTTFTIYLPLTLAIIDGLLVGVGSQRFVLPTLAVRESFRPSRDMVSTVQGRGEMVNVRGRLCPLLRLHEFFGLEPLNTDPTEAIIIVLESNHENRCLMVDQLLGKQEVVIKSLGETFKQSRALAGAAILGDGRVGLILEVNALVHLGHGASDTATAGASRAVVS
jgi:two-component system chemotaxis sensor kinase CheA